MKKQSGFAAKLGRFSLLSLAGIAACFPGAVKAHAGVIISVQSVTANAGSSGNALDVDLTNTGPAALDIAGFSFGIVAASQNISFTDVLTSTAAQYIFGANSLFGPDLTGPLSGQSLTVSDVFAIPLSGVTVNAGSTVGLGHILFDVSRFAVAGPIAVNLDIFPTTGLADRLGANITVNSALPGQITINGVVPVPEPSTLLMFVSGVALIAGSRLRRRKANVKAMSSLAMGGLELN